MTPPPLHGLTDAELERHSAWLRRLARRLVLEEASAEDLVQDAWAVVARRGGGGILDLRAHLAGIVRRLSLARRRREGARRLREERAARPEALPSVAELKASLDAQRALIEELQALEEPLRSTVYLRYYSGLDSAEIARRQGLPPSTVRARLRRGLELLRGRLDRRAGGDRSAWAVVLLELAHPPSAAAASGLLLGGLTMGLGTKIAGLGAALLACFALWHARGQGDRQTPSASPSLGRVEERVSASGGGPGLLAPVRERAAEAPAARLALPPLVVRVVDRTSGQPVPAYAVRAVDEHERAEERESDAEGRFTLPGEWRERAFRLEDAERMSLPPAQQQGLRIEAPDSESGELAFMVDLGPTYVLDFSSAPPRSVYACLAREGFVTHRLSEAGRALRAPLEPGGLPWVRFTPEEASIGQIGAGPWFVRVRDWQGLWQAWGEVLTIRGEHPEPVRMQGGPLGAIELSARLDGELPPVTLDVWTSQVESGGTAPRLDFLSGRGLYRAGECTLGYLPPGETLVRVVGEGVQPIERQVRVRAGEITTLDLELQREAGVHDLVVHVRSQSGTLEMAFVGVSASALAAPGRVVHGQAGGGIEGDARFVLPALEPGLWRVRLERSAHLPPFAEGSELVVDAGAGEVGFTCLDREGPPPTRPRLLILSADDEQPIAIGSVLAYVGGRPFVARSFLGGEVELPAIARGVAIDVFVLADGYRPRALLGIEGPRAEDEPPVSTELARGWGTLFSARGLDGEHGPVEGVEIRLDGAPAGRTDARGLLLVEASAAPGCVALQHPSLHYQAGDVDAATGKLAPHLAWGCNLQFATEPSLAPQPEPPR